MPVWPFMLSIAAALCIWGRRHGAWVWAALAVAGYIGMRAIIYSTPQQVVELSACMWWIVIACCMAVAGGFLPALLYAASALTYPVMMIFGFRIEYMGLSPVVSELFALLALLSIGGDIHGKSRKHNSTSGCSGDTNRQVAYSHDMAKSEPGAGKNIREVQQ